MIVHMEMKMSVRCLFTTNSLTLSPLHFQTVGLAEVCLF
jgi:hypothetical protein